VHSKKLLPLILLAPIAIAYGDVQSSDAVNPPFKKARLAATWLDTSRANTQHLNLNSFVTNISFEPNGSATPYLSAPVADEKPISSVSDAQWIGAVQWREIHADGSLGGSPDVFRGGRAYAAQIRWTQLDSRSPQTTNNRIQTNQTNQTNQTHRTTQGNKRQVDEVESSRVDNQASVVVASSQTAGNYAAAVAGRPARQDSRNNTPIALPDLGDEADASNAPPVKKPYNPAEQGGFNPQANPQTQAGMPMGAPPSPFSPAIPNGVGGGVMGGVTAPPGTRPAAQGGVPIPALNLGDAGAGASISPTTTDVRFESKNYLAHFGLNYLAPGSTYGLGIKADGSYLLAQTLAIGTNLTANNNFKEAVLSGVWMPQDTHLKVKLSGSYMVGEQTFNFYSGNSNANLSQASYYFSTDYVVPKEQSSYLHSVGIATWGSKAKQTNNPDPIYSVVNTTSAYQIMMDPLKLAVGTLQGEALNAQVGLSKQIIVKASAGYESLKFPFSNGTQELDKRIYQDYVVQYQPLDDLTLQAGYKMGAAMNNIMLSSAYSRWKLTAFKNNGVNGITGNQGLALTYTLPLDGNAKAVAFGTLTRPELIGNSAFILRDAATRPIQLPQTFLAKVDTTAVKMVASIAKDIPGVNVNAAGIATVVVGNGANAITSVTRNGQPWAYNSAIQITNQNIAINVKLLPAALATGDTYVLHVTDSSNVPYLVNITTAN